MILTRSDLFRNRVIRYGLLLLALSLAWQLLSWAFGNALLFPSLPAVWKRSFPEIALFGAYTQPGATGALRVIREHLLITLQRVLIGGGGGAILGYFGGMGIAYFPQFEKGSRLLLTMARYIPLFALIPLFLQWFGGSGAGIYLYILFSVFVLVATNTYE